MSYNDLKKYPNIYELIKILIQEDFNDSKYYRYDLFAKLELKEDKTHLGIEYKKMNMTLFNFVPIEIKIKKRDILNGETNFIKINLNNEFIQIYDTINFNDFGVEVVSNNKIDKVDKINVMDVHKEFLLTTILSLFSLNLDNFKIYEEQNELQKEFLKNINNNKINKI